MPRILRASKSLCNPASQLSYQTARLVPVATINIMYYQFYRVNYISIQKQLLPLFVNLAVTTKHRETNCTQYDL